MTNQEAIKLLSMGRLAYNEVEAKAFCEAYNMAIEALKKEPCEDCISRQAAINVLTKTSGIRGDALKALYDLPSVTPAEDAPDTNVGEYINREDALMCLTGEWTELTDEVIHRFIKRIKNLPLMVLPKQRMGQWEWVQYDGNPNIGNWHCSECHCIVEYGKPSYKYCPQCGAKMEEVEE